MSELLDTTETVDAHEAVHETSPAQCSKGWAARCAASKGKRCRCQCGGKNHGGKLAAERGDAPDETLPLTPFEALEYGWDEARDPRPLFPVPDDRVLELRRDTEHGDARVFLDGAPLPRRLVYHSPTGFEWGYGGSGPADLALNILALVVSPKEAMHFHQQFKWDRIATMPDAGGTIPLQAVRVWLDRQYDREAKNTGI